MKCFVPPFDSYLSLFLSYKSVLICSYRIVVASQLSIIKLYFGYFFLFLYFSHMVFHPTLLNGFLKSRLRAVSYFSLQRYYMRNPSTQAMINKGKTAQEEKNRGLLTLLFCLRTKKLSR